MANLLTTYEGRAALRRIACFLGRQFMSENLPRNFYLAFENWKESGNFNLSTLLGSLNELTQDQISELNDCLSAIGCFDEETQSDMTIYVNETTGSDVTGDGSATMPYASLFFVPFLPKRINHNVRVLLETDVTADYLDFQFEFGENGSFSIIGVGEPQLSPISIGSGPFSLSYVNYGPTTTGSAIFSQSVPFTPGSNLLYGKWMRFTSDSTLPGECIPFSGYENLSGDFVTRNGFSAAPIVGDKHEIVAPKITLNCDGINSTCKGSTAIKSTAASRFNIVNMNIDIADSAITSNRFVVDNGVESMLSFVTLTGKYETCRIKSNINQYAPIDSQVDALSQSNLANLTSHNGNGTCCGLNLYREAGIPSMSFDEVIISEPATYVCALNGRGRLTVEGTTALQITRCGVGKIYGRLASSCYASFVLAEGVSTGVAIEIENGVSWRFDYSYIRNSQDGFSLVQCVLRLGPGNDKGTISTVGFRILKGHVAVYTDQDPSPLSGASGDIAFSGGVGIVAFPAADAMQTDSLGNTFSYIST